MNIPNKTQIFIKANRLKNDLKKVLPVLTDKVEDEETRIALTSLLIKDMSSILGFLDKKSEENLYEYLLTWLAIVESHLHRNPDFKLDYDPLDIISKWENIGEEVQENILEMVKKGIEELEYCFTLNFLKLNKDAGHISCELYDSKFDLVKKFLLNHIVFIINIDNVSEDVEKEKLFEYQQLMEHHPVQSDDNVDNAIETEKQIVKPVFEQKKRNMETILQELEDLVGMDAVKTEVKKLVNFVKVNKMREEKGMNKMEISLHTVFTGPPGTGKTTVARLLAEAFREIGILQGGHLVETDRSSLVAGYVGQTAIKTKEVIQSAIDGLLFIDEAYMLNSNDDGYGQEAIDTLLKMMEDNRSRLVVIVAGYENEMDKFIDSNPGLKSRFNKSIFFNNYSNEELMQIFDRMVSKNKFLMDNEARQLVLENIQKNSVSENFGNARYIRNLFEKIIQNQFSRIADLENASNDDMNTIKKNDALNI
jgi:AAA+ superfamily predicted ATPase